MIKSTTLSVLFCLAVTGPVGLRAETKKATVTPGSHEVIKFDGDESGIYQLNIQAGSGHTINDSDFTAAFKADTLWQRNSKTSYSITYTEKPKPPGVSVEGDFEQSGGGGEGYSPNDFLVDVPNVDCEPQDKELLATHRLNGIFQNLILYSAAIRATARWNQEEGCTCTVGVCQNAKFNAYKKYSDGSSIGVSTSTYLLDGYYPNHANHSGTGGDGKKFVFFEDQPSVPIVNSNEESDLQKMHYSLQAENFFMIIPQQGPAVSKMISSWTVSGTVKKNSGGLYLDASSSSPASNGENAGSDSTRAAVASGINAVEYIKKQWKKTSGGQNSMADTYFPQNYWN